MFKHVLVPTDGSPLSDNTVQRAISFARENGAKITFLYAKPEYPITYFDFGEGALINPNTAETFARMTEQQAEAILGTCSKLAQEAGVDCKSIAVTSDLPHTAIIEAAAQYGCDLIFMASHGRRGLSGLLLGSETQKVLTHSKVPVLVYR